MLTRLPAVNDPFGVAVDGAGNYIVSDTDNHRVIKNTQRMLTCLSAVVMVRNMCDHVTQLLLLVPPTPQRSKHHFMLTCLPTVRMMHVINHECMGNGVAFH